jgi:hypothetical protein|tara:strand:+ start:802 stop:1287 length:486 start_codon:yes stop_codon:yes gene_type:complete
MSVEIIKEEMSNFENKEQKKLQKMIQKYSNIIEIIKTQLEDEDLKYKDSISGISDYDTAKVINTSFKKEYKGRNMVKTKERWIKHLEEYLQPVKEHYERKKIENKKEHKIKFSNYLKNELICECGLKITRASLSRHRNTQTHIKKIVEKKKQEEQEELTLS